LSYIFNNFKDGRLFSEVVAEAKEAGYTEPDPRDDLSGTDVARKVQCAILNISATFYSYILNRTKSNVWMFVFDSQNIEPRFYVST
jgi:homoserine dehydrogenase